MLYLQPCTYITHVHSLVSLNLGIINQPLEGVHVTANLKTGNKVSVKIDRAQGLTNRNGEIEFTITALKTGLDWIAWAIPDGNNNIEFNKAAYDNGIAWGMFVNVRENIED